MQFIFGDTRDRVYGQKGMSRSKPEEAARADLNHLDLPSILINEEVAYVADFVTMAIEDFAVANVLARVCKS